MTDRRRLNPPPGGTAPPLYLPLSSSTSPPTRTRPSNTPRRIFLQTGIVPSARGSSYYELQPTSATNPQSSSLLISPTSSLKLVCTVHGPRPLPRNTTYTSTAVLNVNVKYAPFATRTRRAYVRDSTERDLAAHLQTALRGVILGERFPKSCVDVIITVLEGEDDGPAVQSKGSAGGIGGVGVMTVLAGCITAASAALVDAGIDCVDLVAGGVAGVAAGQVLVDPSPAEHDGLESACVVGYLQARDEVTELWLKGNVGAEPEKLVDEAIEAARLSRVVLAAALTEAAEQQLNSTTNGGVSGPG